ncbi:MAG: hypothetical protein QNJ00_13105 [Woeseiaceae bacterium]|nr:hypothetical protein [Woeseiaceae bacterium]
MQIVETSMNFDLDMLEKLLRSLSDRCPRFDDGALTKTMALVKGMKHDETQRHSVEVEFDGDVFYLGFEFFMDDIDAPDVRFWGTPAFVAWLESEYEAICDELGI